MKASKMRRVIPVISEFSIQYRQMQYLREIARQLERIAIALENR